MQHLMALGLSQSEVAQRLGVTRGAIVARLKREGLTWPARHNQPARPAALTPEEDQIALAETGGRYVELSDWARRRGLTHTQALQRWHRLGMPAKAKRA